MSTPVQQEVSVAITAQEDWLHVACSQCGTVGTYQVPVVAAEAKKWHENRHAGAHVIHLHLTTQQFEEVARRATRRGCTPEAFVRDVITAPLTVHSKHRRGREAL